MKRDWQRDWQLEFKLKDIARESKTLEEYEAKLVENDIKYLEIKTDKYAMIVPEYIYNGMNQKEKAKLFKYLGEN